MRPIPVKMLIHTAVLSNVTRDDYGKETDVPVATLERVRFRPTTRVVTGANGSDIQCVATLYVDAVASRPQGVDVHVDQSVVWEDRRYRVADVAREYDARRLHHLKVALVDG